MVKGFWCPIERMERLFHSLDLTYIQTSLISFVAQCKIHSVLSIPWFWKITQIKK